jgi:hypothetical protein
LPAGRHRHLPCKSSRAVELLTCERPKQGKEGLIEPGVTVSAPGSQRDLSRTWHDGNPFRVMHSGACVASDPSLIGYGRRRWGDGRCSADLGGVPTAGSVVGMTGQDPHRPGLLAWSARHLPWWVPMALWYPAMTVWAVFSVALTGTATVGTIDGAIVKATPH